MSIFFSRQCEYALQAVLYLGMRRDGSLVSIKKISRALSIPTQFLAKIFQDLTRKKLLYSHRGPKGGFRLRVPADEITLLQVVEAIDGVQIMENCIMGFPKCSAKNPCPLHRRWAQLRERLSASLVEKSIGDFARDIRMKPGYRSARMLS